MQLTNLIRNISLIGAFVFATLSPTARAVDPPPDGGYPNFNTAEGDSALFNLTIGSQNTAIGYEALFSNTSGGGNTAIGDAALLFNTTGGANTANGVNALFGNTTGNNNTGAGVNALLSNTTGNDNTANGTNALVGNTTGSFNTAEGFQALATNTTGDFNTASGFSSLSSNTTGTQNTANGVSALQSNTTGNNNTATGLDALKNNTTGGDNTASGFFVLRENTTGNSNTGLGESALINNTTGSSNVALGFDAGSNLTTGSSNIDIGHRGVAGESRTIRIGTRATHRATFIAGISGATVAGGVGVIIDTNGHLGTVVCSERFKDAIKPMDRASEAILALRPVTFRYKHELDPAGIPQFGLVAEQVEKVNPALVARDDEGKAYTVRYEAVNAMLLNEFLKEHRKVEALGRKDQEQTSKMRTHDYKIENLETTIAEQQKEIQALTATLKAQASQIQKVNNEIELIKPRPREVANR